MMHEEGIDNTFLTNRMLILSEQKMLRENEKKNCFFRCAKEKSSSVLILNNL